ncbi:MAG: FtsX-like permease family protein [Planctomycetes bacterium]|nr:FtsX-like permease family protein [Planctomycetota bacterium]
MLIRTGLAILAHERPKYAGAVLGTAISLFLMLLLSGFYFGFRRDITIVPDSFDADLWVSSRPLLTFDFAAPFDDLAWTTALSTPGVRATTRVVAAFTRWRIPGAGGMESVQVLGFDPDAGVRAAFGDDVPDLSSRMRADGGVLIDWKDTRSLGVARLDEFGAEVGGRSARPVGWLKNRHLFNAAYLVVTDVDNARRHLRLPANAIHYLAVKCAPGADPAAVAAALRERLPELQVHEAAAFHDLTQDYWADRTGIEPMLFLSMTLSSVVGFMTVFLTFFLLTSQKLSVFAAMKALGASTADVGVLLWVQLAVVFASATALAGAGLYAAVLAFADTPISVVLPPPVVAGGIGLMALACAFACVPSLVKVARTAPAEAFRT